MPLELTDDEILVVLKSYEFMESEGLVVLPREEELRDRLRKERARVEVTTTAPVVPVVPPAPPPSLYEEDEYAPNVDEARSDA